MARLPIVLPKNCDPSVRLALQRLTSVILDSTATPTFYGLILTGTTASRLLATNSSKELTSVSSLASWVAGTTNQVNITNDGDGTITLSLPQDIDANANPLFEGFTIQDTSDLTVVFCDVNEFYITEYAEAEEIVTGNPIGLLLVLTYTV